MDLWVTPAMHWSSKNGLGAMWSAFGQLRSLRRHSVWRTGIVISRPRGYLPAEQIVRRPAWGPSSLSTMLSCAHSRGEAVASHDGGLGPVTLNGGTGSECNHWSAILYGLADCVLACWTLESPFIVAGAVWLDPLKPHRCPALWASRETKNQPCRIEGFPF